LPAVAAMVIAVPATAVAKARITFEQTVSAGGSFSVTTSTHDPASFSVVLRVPRQGRAQLFLSGRNAPKGGPLIDTRTYGCERAARSLLCRAAYEPLPKGNYTWRVRWLGKKDAQVAVTVRW